MRRYFMGPLLLAALSGLATAATYCQPGWSSQVIEIWVGDVPAVFSEDVTTQWTINGLDCSAAGGNACRMSFAIGLYQLSAALGEYVQVKAEPASAGGTIYPCGTSWDVTSGKWDWGNWGVNKYELRTICFDINDHSEVIDTYTPFKVIEPQ